MSKNKQILIFSLIGLAVLAAVTAVLLLTAPADKKDDTVPADNDFIEEQDEALILSDKKASDVLSVGITNDSGTFTLTDSGKTSDDGEKLWTIEDISAAPLNDNLLTNAVNSAAGFTAKEFAEEVADPSELAKYGLDAPKATVKTVFADGTEFSFSVGNDVPSASATAYITADNKNVYTAYKSAISYFSRSKYEFVSLKAVPDIDTNTEEITKVTVERADLDEPLIIEEIPTVEGEQGQVFSFRMTSPYTAYADLTNSAGIVYSLSGLEAASCEWVGVTDVDYQLAGLDDPNCVITVESTAGTHTLTLGNVITEAAEGEDASSGKIRGILGISSDVPDVLYMFDVSSITLLNIMPDSVISKLFLMPYIYSVSSVSYTDSDGRSLDIGIGTVPAASEDADDEHYFIVNGENIGDSRAVKDLYQYFIGAVGDETYFEDEKGEFRAEIVYNYIDPENGIGGKDVVRFYDSNDDRKVIISLNGENLFKSRQMYLTQLFKNVDSFMNGGEIVQTF